MGSAPRPFTIRIFLPGGKPEGLRVVEKSNWTGCGIVFPRALFREARERQELSRTGIYVLCGPSDVGDRQTIYVGQADPVGRRLEQHHSQKDFWTWATVFVSKDGSLNRAHAQFLESRLLELAREAKRADLENQNTPQLPSLTEADRADAESFLLDILSIFPLVGLPAFEQPRKSRGRKANLQIQAKAVTARGYESAEGFVVVRDSQAVMEEVPSIHQYISTLRLKLRSQGVLAEKENALVFMQDYAFTSPSLAASIVLGRNTNGRIAWKDGEGRTLREIQEG